MDALEIKNDYLDFIKDSLRIENCNENLIEVVTPYVDPFGESIGFNILIEGNQYIVTDDGYTIWNLQSQGINITRQGYRQELFSSFLKYNNFEIIDDEIKKVVPKNQLSQSIHDMTQLLISTYDLVLLHPKSIQNHFFEDVKTYFLENDSFLAFPEFSIVGRSQLQYKFDFVFMKKGESKLVRVENMISKHQVESILTSWLDTSDYRKNTYGDKENLTIIVSHDGFKKIKKEYVSALNKYNINILDFDNKDLIIQELGA